MTTTTAPDHIAASSRRSDTARTVVGTTALAVAVNVTLWAIGRAFGVSFADHEASVPAAGVAVLTAVPFLLSLTITALVSVRRPGFLRFATVAGPTISVATIGLTVAATFDAASTVWLAAMHIALIPVLLAGLARIGRRANS